MSFFSRLGDFGRKVLNFVGLPTDDTTSPTIKSVSSTATPHTPTLSPERNARIAERAAQLHAQQMTQKELEQIFFNPNLPIDERKSALEEWTDITGWYRPEENSTWTNEQWQRWEEVYEAEEELW